MQWNRGIEANIIVRCTDIDGKAVMRVHGCLGRETRAIIKRWATEFTTVSTYLLDRRSHDCLCVFHKRLGDSFGKLRENNAQMQIVFSNLYSQLDGTGDGCDLLDSPPNPSTYGGGRNSKRNNTGVTRDIKLSEVIKAVTTSVQRSYAKEVLRALGVKDVIDFCERFECCVVNGDKRWGTRKKLISEKCRGALSC